MQRFVYFVTVFALSVAKDVSVYNPSEYYNGVIPVPVYESTFPWKFGFNSRSRLNMEIRYRNKPPNVTAVSVSYETGEESFEVPRNVSSYKALSDGFEVFKFECNLSDSELKLNVQIQYKLNNWCASKTVVRTKKRNNRSNKKEYKYKDICLKETPCVLVVDLKNFVCHDQRTQKPKIITSTAETFTGSNNYHSTTKAPKDKVTETTKYTGNVTKPAEQQTPSILLYVITPVIVMSVISVAVYIIVKKHRQRNTYPVDTLDLNIYATPKEVIYADLSLAHGDSKPPRRDQDSPYAQIIGVMRPVDANIKKK